MVKTKEPIMKKGPVSLKEVGRVIASESESSDEKVEVKPVRTRKPAEKPVVEKKEGEKDVTQMREELLRLSEDGDIEKSVAYLRKASEKMVRKIYCEYEKRRMAKANEFITDMLISKWSDLLGGLDAIERPEALARDLEKDKLLRNDVLRAVEVLSPFIPFIGILSGGMTTAKHIYDYKSKVGGSIREESPPSVP